MVPIYALVVVAPSLVGVAVVLAVIRAKRDDLPDIVRALMRLGPRDDERTLQPAAVTAQALSMPSTALRLPALRSQ